MTGLAISKWLSIITPLQHGRIEGLAEPGGEILKKGNWLITIATAALIVVVLAPASGAFNGGVGTSDKEYGCGDNCHDDPSTCTIAMSATNTTPAPGDTVTVTVDVSGGQASGNELGVMIASATTTTNSLPSDGGWTIISDPAGTAYNYYEVDSYTGSLSASWDLSAPTELGIHMLFARVLHGGDGPCVADYSGGLMFTVTDYTGGGDGGDDNGTATTVPTIVITAPSNSATVKSDMTVNVNVIATVDDPVVSITLKIDGDVFGELTSAPYSWVVDTKSLTEGGHVLVVTAVDSTGDSVSKEIAVFVDNESEMVSMLEWIVTMGAGTVAIICIVGIMIVTALYIRKRVVDRRSR
jgi:hypothetical protein